MSIKKTVEVSELIELEEGFVLIMIKDISVKTKSGIIKSEKQIAEEAKTQHSESVTVVHSHERNRYQKGDKVYTLAQAKDNNLPLRFEETGEQTYYLIEENLIFGKKK